MAKLAAFDLDGTLFDTTKVNYYAYKKVLEPMGYHPTLEFFRKECFGHDYSFFGPLLAPGASPEELEQIHREKIQNYPEMLKYARKNEPLFQKLHSMRGEYYIALVTVGSEENSNYILDAFGEKESFDLILNANDIKKKKPDPDGYLMAMRYFGVAPEDTIIFEDSPTGIAAAHASGAQVVVVEGYN